MKLILALIPKRNFILVSGFAIMKMYKNFQRQEAIVSKVQTQLNIIKFP
jgi:hypothetical protein